MNNVSSFVTKQTFTFFSSASLHLYIDDFQPEINCIDIRVIVLRLGFEIKKMKVFGVDFKIKNLIENDFTSYKYIYEIYNNYTHLTPKFNKMVQFKIHFL